MPENLLASYPRSGNTWLRYIVEEITGKATKGYHGKDLFKFTRPGASTEIILRKTHMFYVDCSENNHLLCQAPKMILLHRNPYYVVPRHLAAGEPRNAGYQHYMSLFEAYDSFEREKMLVSYEDLILNLEDTINKILSFLNDEDYEKPLQKFLLALEQNREKSIELYNKKYGQCETIDTGFMPTNIEEIEKEKGRRVPFLQREFPHLMKYLTQY